MFSIYQLARNTLKESLREPIYFLMLATALVMIGLFPTLAMFVFRKQIRLVVDSSMATTLLFGLFISVLCAGHTISREMKNGTVLLLLSKPVTRFSFILSKILGILTAVSIFVFLCSCATVTSVLIAKDQFQLDNTAMAWYFGVIFAAALYGGARNFFSQASFSANAIGGMLAGLPMLTAILYLMRVSALGEHGYDPEEFMSISQLAPALLLLFPAVWTMGSIAVALATRLEFVSNLLICLALFLTGLVSQYLASQWFGEGFTSSFLRALLPNWQYFWMADALANLQKIPLSYLLWSLLYVFIYIAIWGIWALYLFQDRELAKDSR